MSNIREVPFSSSWKRPEDGPFAYVGAFIAVMAFFYRSFAEGFLTRHTAAPVAGLLAWSTASLFIVPVIATTAGQLRGLHPRGGDHA